MPSYIPVEYDPFAPVEVDYNPWEGQPDPFVYQPISSRWTDDNYFERRRQAKNVWEETATDEEKRDDTYALIEASQKLRAERELLNTPSYAEGEIMPRTPRQQQGEDVYSQERYARGDAPGREQPLIDALTLRDYGYYGPADPRIAPPGIAPTPENQRRKELGEPISDFRYQPPLTQQEIDQYLQRPPVALDVAPARPAEAWFENPSWLRAETPEGYAQPYPSPSGLSGGYSRGKLFDKYSPLRGTYRHSIPF